MVSQQSLLISLISLLALSGLYLGFSDKQNTLEQGLYYNSSNYDYQDLLDLYNNWKFFYGKQTEKHSEYRFNVFLENYEKVMTHNAKDSSYKLGLNQFADLTDDEFTAQYLMQLQDSDSAKSSSIKASDYQKNPNTYFSGSIDFRKQGVVNSIQNQGKCGSCYTFAAAQALESAYALQTSKGLLKFSEQQLVSCSQSYGNEGCNGGFGNSTFSYVIDNGIVLLQDLPYVSGENGDVPACTTNQGQYYISSYTQIYGLGNCLSIQESAEQQPLYARVIATDWKLYSSGIFDGCSSQDPNLINHGVGIIGFNTTASSENGRYWIIRNSWGTTWGENGYMRLQFGNTCAICHDSYFPTV